MCSRLDKLIASKNIEGFARALESGSDPNQLFGDPRNPPFSITPLYQACRAHIPEIVELLVNHELIDVNLRSGISDAAPLHVAVKRSGSKKIVKMLLSHPKCDPNVLNNEGYSPLSVAIINRKIEYIKLMLSHEGIDVNIREPENDGNALLLAVEQCGQGEIVDNADLEIVNCILSDSKSIDVNAHDGRGSTCLHIAAGRKSNIGVVKLLLAHPNIDVECIDDYGRTALFDAKDSAIASLLLANGADPNHSSIDADRPLEVHFAHGSFQTVKLLLEHGAAPFCNLGYTERKFRSVEKKELIKDYADNVWGDGIPPLTLQCIWRLKRMRSKLNERDFVDYIPDAMVFEHFRNWKGAKKWIVAWLGAELEQKKHDLHKLQMKKMKMKPGSSMSTEIIAQRILRLKNEARNVDIELNEAREERAAAGAENS